PNEILSEYTALTGRSPLPPLWSFGLWMSRNTYRSEDEVRAVAAKLRENRIPCDVIHIDPGWFEREWHCDFKFSTTRYSDPSSMVKDLREQGFHISLWQLPYLLPGNELFREAVEKGYVIFNGDGDLPTEDAIIDFSNPGAVRWYQEKLKKVLEMGIGAIKADFGEAAPINGVYASGKSGFYEHNLYPLRYNKAVSEITREVTGESIIWARSAWAGSQRYPLHWGGDAENTDSSMAATLRAGLSLGLCGFSFWSHDIGGFVQKSPEELYRRWLPFGMLTSHSRCHGTPPKEPWEYSNGFIDDFRRVVELKYSLLPYIYTQAKLCSEQGFPMMRTLLFEYPDDCTAWFIEDEYLFGTDILVAPLFEEGRAERAVYLPEGLWIDYQSGAAYTGGKWHRISAGLIPAIILVRDGTALMHVKVEQSTMWINWNEIEIRVYNSSGNPVNASLFIPGEDMMLEISLEKTSKGYVVKGCNLPGKLKFNICEMSINILNGKE
ncbi:MAG TPA: alpha-xylosidase, partial [Clostridiaceae bacterium]|nr:alpha-xylosidase [Clostridiaceae bacterium]